MNGRVKSGKDSCHANKEPSLLTKQSPNLQGNAHVQTTTRYYAKSEVDMTVVPVASIRDTKTLYADKIVNKGIPKQHIHQPHQMGVVSFSFLNDQLALSR